MNEAEAKEKICPFSWSVPEIPGIREGGPWFCRASGCMAWRVTSEQREDVSGATEEAVRSWEAIGWRREVTTNVKIVMVLGGDGYCGLAAKP